MRVGMRTLAIGVGALALLAPATSGKPGDIIVGDSERGKVYRVNPETGGKRLVSDDPRLAAPNDVVFDRKGRIYVADYQAFADNGGVFKINPRSGETRVVSRSDLFQQPDGIALGPSGDLFVTEIETDNGELFKVRLPGGGTSVVSDDPLLDGPIGVVVPPDGRPATASSDVAVRVNPITGVGTTIADSGDGLDAGGGITRAADGTLYMADSDTGLQSIDPATGAVDDLSGPVPYDGYGMGIDFRGRVLVTAEEGVAAVNPRNGGVRPIASGFGYAEGLEVEPPRCGGLTATIVGTTGRDTLKGSGFGDVIAGLGGGDTIKGKGGRDVICGGKGRDGINGGPGRDRCDGQQGRDRERRC